MRFFRSKADLFRNLFQTENVHKPHYALHRNQLSLLLGNRTIPVPCKTIVIISTIDQNVHQNLKLVLLNPIPIIDAC